MRKHVDTAILGTRREIYNEAAPILYTQAISLYIAPFSTDPSLGWLTDEFKISLHSRFTNIEVDIDLTSASNDYLNPMLEYKMPQHTVMNNLIRNMNGLRHFSDLKIRLHLADSSSPANFTTCESPFGVQDTFKDEALRAMTGGLNNSIKNLTQHINLSEKAVKRILKRYNIPSRKTSLTGHQTHRKFIFRAAIVKETYNVGKQDWTVIEKRTMVLGMQIAPSVPALRLPVREVLDRESAAMVKECADGQFHKARLPLDMLRTGWWYGM